MVCGREGLQKRCQNGRTRLDRRQTDRHSAIDFLPGTLRDPRSGPTGFQRHLSRNRIDSTLLPSRFGTSGDLPSVVSRIDSRPIHLEGLPCESSVKVLRSPLNAARGRETAHWSNFDQWATTYCPLTGLRLQVNRDVARANRVQICTERGRAQTEGVPSGP